MDNRQNDVKVSIVMPVYNTAPYLRQCLDSVLAQTLEEFELICVDDGSTDGSVEILEEYAANDKRIKILQQKNQYAGVARNNGLKIARGEYIIFLDSDDVFSDVLLEHTYNAGVEKEADIVFLDILRFDHKANQPITGLMKHHLLPEKDVFSAKDIPDTIFSIVPQNTFSSIYRREFINEHNLQFQALPNSNDVYFTLYARALAERITIVDEQLVYYRSDRAGSLQSTQKDSAPLFFLQAFYALYTDLVKDGLFEPLKKGFQSRFLDTLLYNLNSVKTTKARLAILQAFDEEPYCNLPFNEEPEADKSDKMLVKYFKEVMAARNWYHKNLRINQLGEELKNNKTAPPLEEQGIVTVSVIIPVYNTEEYLREALDSIVDQTLKDIEIICINDGSTDGSAEILEEYAKKDNRISIITQENKGLSCSRNAGMMKAKGKYIYFMDSDDILETTALEELIPIMEEKNLDVMCFDGESFAENPELLTPYYQTAYRRSKAYDDVYEGAEYIKMLGKKGEYSYVVWLQIYKTSFLRDNDLYCIPGILHEDTAFTFSASLNAKRVSHTNKAYFHRRLRGNSIMTNDTKFENVYGRYVCYWDMLKIYYAKLPNLSEDAAHYAMHTIYVQLANAQDEYEKLSVEDSGSELGMTDDLYVFRRIVVNSANANKFKKLSDNKNITIRKLRERNKNLKEKLNRQKDRSAQLKEKLNAQKGRSKELKGKLNNQKEKNKELKEKLNNAKSSGANNKELEKYKKENEALRKKLKAARAENKKIKNSRAYKLGRIIMYIPHRIKRLFKK